MIEAPRVGDRFELRGEEYVVNRLQPGNSGRLQIDCMTVEELTRRRNNLTALLEEGTAAGGSGTSVAGIEP